MFTEGRTHTSPPPPRPQEIMDFKHYRHTGDKKKVSYVEIRKWKSNWIGHILRRDCLLQRVIEGKIKGGIEVTGRRGRKRRKLLEDFKERRGYSHLKEEALDRTMWRARFGKGLGPVVRQTTKRMTSNRRVGFQ
jgi:hypothetical protein